MDPITMLLIAAGSSLIGGTLSGLGAALPKKTEQSSWTDFETEDIANLQEAISGYHSAMNKVAPPTLAQNYLQYKPSDLTGNFGRLSSYGRQLASQQQNVLAQQAARTGQRLQRQLASISPAIGAALAAQARQRAQLAGATIPFQALQSDTERQLQRANLAMQQAQLGAELQRMQNQTALQQMQANIVPSQLKQNLIAILANLAQMRGVRQGKAERPFDWGAMLSGIGQGISSAGSLMGAKYILEG